MKKSGDSGTFTSLIVCGNASRRKLKDKKRQAKSNVGSTAIRESKM